MTCFKHCNLCPLKIMQNSRPGSSQSSPFVRPVHEAISQSLSLVESARMRAVPHAVIGPRYNGAGRDNSCAQGQGQSRTLERIFHARERELAYSHQILSHAWQSELEKVILCIWQSGFLGFGHSCYGGTFPMHCHTGSTCFSRG